MKLANLKSKATDFLSGYEKKNPATYAAAQQAIGGVLILDGFIGIDNPLGGRKRPGIFGSLIGIIVGILFLFVPTIFGSVTGTSKMTATTSATVVSVSQPTTSNTTNSNGTSSSGSSSCNAVASYTVNDRAYNQNSAFSSSGLCSLAPGSTITINYNPAQPEKWGYQVATLNKFLKIFMYVGVLVIITSLFTFMVRLLSIIFGWKLLKSGRALAKTLPAGTDLGTMINEIKHAFSRSIFGGGNPIESAIESKLEGKNDKPASTS